jgi:hypothetical protein
MKKIVFTDCNNKTYTIEEKDFRYDLKDDDNHGFVTDTNGTRISAMFIVQGLFNGRTKIVDKHILLSTDTDQYTYEDYKEWCDECDVDCIYEEGSTEFYDWVHEQIDEDIRCDKINMRDSKYAERNFIITGTLGLWNGHPDIQPVFCHGLCEAIDKCISGNDIWDYDVFINDDEDFITVHAKHHDGTNVFEIHMLTREGTEAWEKAYEEYEYGDADFPELKEEWFEKIEFNKIF